jgi:type III restriction enzyme
VDRSGRWPRCTKHIYANGEHLFPATFTGRGKDVLNTELGRDGIIAWYRNPTGGTAALAVPYEQSGTHRTMYPDFVFFHEEDGGIVADLVDAHRPDSADTGPKWSALAESAVKHSKEVRRVLAMIKSADGQLLSLDLRNPDVAIELAKANNETDIRAIFAEYGGTY